MLILFYIFSLIALLSSLAILFIRNMIHNALMLMITMVSMAGLFLLLGADFLAIAQLMIYVGGIIIIILFGIMLTQRNPDTMAPQSNFRISPISLLATLGFSICLFLFVYQLNQSTFLKDQQQLMNSSTVSQIGILLMTKNIVAFEVAGILLMVALIGASVIASAFQNQREESN